MKSNFIFHIGERKIKLIHRKITYALTESAIPIWHLNMVEILLVDTLVSTRSTVGSKHADRAVCNVSAIVEMIVCVVIKLKIINVALDNNYLISTFTSAISLTTI